MRKGSHALSVKLDALRSALAHGNNDREKWNKWFWTQLKQDSEAIRSLKRLVGRCDVHLLWYCLWVLGSGPESRYRPKDTWRYLFGFDRRQLETVACCLLTAANYIEKLNESEVPAQYLLVPEVREEVLRVPLILRAYKALIAPGPNRPKMRPKDAPMLRVHRAILIHHVRERMGNWHDRDLANLFAVASSRSSYTEANWREWRKDNKAFLLGISRALRLKEGRD
jgi:hypothetical protein